MPEILVIEDDSFKSQDICDEIRLKITNAAIDQADSVSTAIDRIGVKKYDLIVIDMALPSHPVVSGGGSPMSLLSGGMEIILELQSLGRSDPCVVLTQYPEIEISGDFYPVSNAARAIEDRFGCKVKACLIYSESESVWRDVLLEALVHHGNSNS